MTDSTNDFEGRARGRPATGQKPVVKSAISAELLARVDDFAAGEFTSRSEAISRLLDEGLKGHGR